MIEFIIKNSPTIALLIFFSFFCYILWSIFKPGAKKKFDKLANIPFDDEKQKNKKK